MHIVVCEDDEAQLLVLKKYFSETSLSMGVSLIL